MKGHVECHRIADRLEAGDEFTVESKLATRDSHCASAAREEMVSNNPTRERNVTSGPGKEVIVDRSAADVYRAAGRRIELAANRAAANIHDGIVKRIKVCFDIPGQNFHRGAGSFEIGTNGPAVEQNRAAATGLKVWRRSIRRR